MSEKVKDDELMELETEENLPVLPLRDVVVYPKMIVPIFVGRDKSIEAVQAANDQASQIILVMQRYY